MTKAGPGDAAGTGLSALPPESSLALARTFSERVMARMTAMLERRAPTLDAIETVAVGGSLGRLEAHRGSDFDCLIIARAQATPDAIAEQSARVLETLATVGLKAPKAHGIYRSAIVMDALLEPTARGRIDESPQVFGARMGMLLDAQPVYRPGACRELQRAILSWYGYGYHDADPQASWTYLLNDLARYLHAYAGWQQYKFDRSPDDSWQLRQAKLRSTRLLTFAATMFLLGATNECADKQARVLAALRRTPLERLEQVMVAHDPEGYARLLGHYERLHATLANRDLRQVLIDTGPQSAEEMVRGKARVYLDFERESGVMMTCLTRFLLARQNDWDPRFFERLLFF